MKKLILVFVACVLIFVSALCFTQPAFAHSGIPRLEINPERTSPGGVVDVRGVEFEYEEPVTLYLERPGVVVQLGQMLTDLEGIFIYTAVLPVDLPAGEYNIRAQTAHHEVLSPALTIQGSAILAEAGGQGVRAQDDGLLAPMPTFAPGESSTALPGQPAPERADPRLGLPVLPFLLLAGIGILSLIGMRVLKQR